MKVRALIQLLQRLDAEDLVAIPCGTGDAERAQMVVDALVTEASPGSGRIVTLIGLSHLDIVSGDVRSLGLTQPEWLQPAG